MPRHASTWAGNVGLALALAVLVPLVLGPGLRAARAPSWSRDSLPPALRGRVHLSAADVPAFPQEDKRLHKPEGWPAEMTIGGVRCVRRIHAWDDDDAVALASLKDVEPVHRLMLFYDHANSDWNSASAGWGPRYSWDRKGKLMQRLWYEPDSARLVTHDYTYYRSGRLLGYSWRTERRNQGLDPKSYEFISQFFDENGRLLALGYEKMGVRSRDSLYAWMGAVVPYDDFRMKTHILYSKAHPGDR